MLASDITDDMTQCPRCHAPRSLVAGTNDTGFILFDCGSQANKYSPPWWMDECYQRAGVEALTELVADRACTWHMYSKVIEGTDQPNVFEADLHEATQWLHEAGAAANQAQV